MQEKKTIFSGIQPSGKITLGNYVGALRNWVKLQDEYDCIFSVVDMHAITVPQVPAMLRKNTLELLSLYIAAGINPEKCTLFVQSHVSEHAELAWILNTISYVGELSRMTQFKDKSKKSGENICMGLMDYPVLMAADILLYQADLVPVGADQKQHLELARDLGQRFNSKYSETFKIPDGYIPESGARIMSLADPSVKMSKSDENENAFILLSDDKDAIIRKFKRAVTDSGSDIIARSDKPGITNLLNIYASLTGKTIEGAEKDFSQSSYAELKETVAVAVYEALKPIQDKQKDIIANKPMLEKVLAEGRDKAKYMARKTLNKVYKKVGFYQL